MQFLQGPFIRRGSSGVERRFEEPCVEGANPSLAICLASASANIPPCHGGEMGSIPMQDVPHRSSVG